MKRVHSVIVFILVLMLSVSVVAQADSWNFWQNTGTSFSGGKNSNPWGSYWSNFDLNDFNPTPSKPTEPTEPQPSEPIQPVEPEPSEPEESKPPLKPGVPGQPLQPLQPQPNKVPRPTDSLTSVEKQLIDLVNQERAAHGLGLLEVDMTLVKLAKDKSHEMASTGEVIHYARSKFHSILDDAGVDYRQAGENLAKAGSITRVHNGLMLSSGHRANIMYSGYTHIGVGIVKYGTMYYATEIFICK